jgi:hypothetical protein
MQTKPSPGKPLVAAALTLLACAAAHADYPSTVLSDSPKAYYRLNDDTNRTLINQNSGSLGAAGNATNDLSPGVVHSFPGAIVGDPNRSVFFDGTTRTEIPFHAALNPPNTQPFTLEAWLYPPSDQTGTGMSPLANRWTQGGNRQGWVFYQRRPDSSYVGTEGVGWECRMYNDLDGGGHLDVVSQVPYRVGEWQHVVVVYDPVGGDPTNATLTMYINGVAANTNLNTAPVPGYAPVTGNHDPAPNGQPALALGNYNNANSSLNPWFGAADEFAFYSNKLSPEQILAHYENGTNAARSTPYEVLVKSHNPVAYLRLDEVAPTPDLALNLGDLRAAGSMTNTAGVNHPAPSALQDRTDDGSTAYHQRNGSATTSLAYLAQNNPDASVPFTFEAWLRPTSDRQNPGACPVNNRYSKGTDRTGWAIFQRAPNATYSGVSGYSGVGWTFRMYSGTGGGGQDVTTATDYQAGQWQHLVVTWQPAYFNDPQPTNGGVAYGGYLTAYVNGTLVAMNANAIYCANLSTNLDGSPAADLAIGSYNAASSSTRTLGENPFEGDVDEVAIYTGFTLTSDQVLEHYTAGTNAYAGTNYETLVLTAGLLALPVPGTERAGLPRTYLRFNEKAFSPATNSGTLGCVADARQIAVTNVAAGPQPPTYAGFDAANTALALNGSNQWASLNNPGGLNISNRITLEAWVQPAATQADPARIVAHGAPTYSSYLGGALPTIFGAPTNGNEVFLKVEGPGPRSYTFGCSTFTSGLGTNYHVVTAAAPAGDFGTGTWVHLVGTYDGANWKLYRNGALLASTADQVGALTVDDGGWAIGATGNGWANNFAGAADEVAIYDTALSAARIATHYLMGRAGTTALAITSSGNNVTITWPAGSTLQQSSTVAGPYADVPGSPTSPLTLQASGTKFYRWRL